MSPHGLAQVLLHLPLPVFMPHLAAFNPAPSLEGLLTLPPEQALSSSLPWSAQSCARLEEGTEQHPPPPPSLSGGFFPQRSNLACGTPLSLTDGGLSAVSL